MGENRLMADLYEENQRLKERTKELEEKHFSECGQIAHYDDELRQAKELLKAAVEDIAYALHSFDTCKVCALRTYDDEGEAFCPAVDDTNCGEICKWQHEAEALALIGEDTNVPATATDTNVGGKMRVNYEGDGYDDDGNIIYDTAYCPKCGQEYEVDYDNHDNYCRNCGQALDWSTDGGADNENS